MSNKVAILGSGGHARSLIELAESCHLDIAAVYDQSFCPDRNEKVGGYLLAGSLDQIPANVQLLLALGDNLKREEMYHRFSANLHRLNVKHQTAYVAADTVLGEANQLFGHVFVNAQVHIGDNNIINTGAIIEHESRVGSHNHISVGAILCGRVAIGDHCMIGAGSVVIDNITVCDHVTVGANSTVTQSIDQPGVYVGSPARRVK